MENLVKVHEGLHSSVPNVISKLTDSKVLLKVFLLVVLQEIKEKSIYSQMDRCQLRDSAFLRSVGQWKDLPKMSTKMP